MRDSAVRPVDRHAFVSANRLIGNDDDAAGRECTLIGPRLCDRAPRTRTPGSENRRTVTTRMRVGHVCPRWGRR